MPNRKTLKKQKKPKKVSSLHKEINNFILKQGDICCEENISREKIIELIFKSYESLNKLLKEEDYVLDTINNDILVFIGIMINLQKNNNIEGVKLWKKMDKEMLQNKKPNEKKIKKLLNELPLYYLLSFLGWSYYKMDVNLNV